MILLYSDFSIHVVSTSVCHRQRLSTELPFCSRDVARERFYFGRLICGVASNLFAVSYSFRLL